MTVRGKAEEEKGHRVFAPLHVPLHRRMSTFCLLLQYSSPALMSGFFYFLCCFPILWPGLIIYLVFFYFWDRSPSNGDALYRYSDYMRGTRFLRYVCDYFPVNVHKTVDLKPTYTKEEIETESYVFPLNYLPFADNAKVFKFIPDSFKRKKLITKEKRIGPRYIFGYHPHGFIAWGSTCVFACSRSGFEDLFPGIRCFLLTLVNQFRLPLYRDYLLSIGISSVTKQNIKALLLRDQSVCIVVGGASESLLTKPNTNNLVLKKRKGFIKQALQVAGKSHTSFIDQIEKEENIMLVPVYCFGETDLYNIYETTSKQESYFRKMLRYLQLAMKNSIGFTIPLVFARGIFNYDFGFMPFRRELNVVFGKPINVERMFGRAPGDPISDEEIDHYHDLYMKNLRELFDDNKDKYLRDGYSDMDFVE